MILYGYEEIPPELYGAVIAIGNFDGVHIGHQEIIKTAVSIAKRQGSKVGVMTFDPHPNSVLGKSDNQKLLMDIFERANKLLAIGADFVVIVRFTKEFASLMPLEFVNIVLSKSLKVSHIVTGYNFRFGAKGLGDTRFIAQQAEALGFGFTQVNHIKYLGFEVSTSYIKALITNGRILMAAYLLGGRYVLSGVVTQGKQMAAPILETPTANIDIGEDRVLPLYGVYLVKASLDDGSVYYGVANIGVRPTVDDVDIPKLEVHLFDFTGDLYGSIITVELVSFIRPERKLNGMEDLKYAIAADKNFGRYLCRNARSLGLVDI